MSPSKEDSTSEMREQLERDLNEVIGEEASLLDRKYRQWCMDHPEKIMSADTNIVDLEQIGDLQLSFVKTFHETSPDIFDDILNMEENVENKKDDDKAVVFREEGNKLYQKKQFPVGSLSRFLGVQLIK